MKRIIILLLNILILLGCSNSNIIKESVGNSLKIIILVDKTLSIKNNSVPEVKLEELSPVIDYISKNGGELALGSITTRSKENLEIIRCNLLPKPIQGRGETGLEFNKRIVKYKKAKTNYQDIKDPIIFLERKNVKNILDYSRLYGTSDITGGFELANLYLNETDLFFGEDIYKVALFVTDGVENMDRYKLPDKINYDLIIVNRSSNAGVLEKYKKENFTNFQSAISLHNK